MKHQHRWEYSLDLMGWKCDCGMATIDRKNIVTFDEARADYEAFRQKHPMTAKDFLGEL